jgi:hypothetical protein
MRQVVLRCEEMREDRGKRGERVGAFGGELRAGSDGSAAYVEEDEGGDEDGIEGDVLPLDVGVQDGALVEGEVAATGQEDAADDERNDADEDKGAKNIGE